MVRDVDVADTVFPKAFKLTFATSVLDAEPCFNSAAFIVDKPYEDLGFFHHRACLHLGQAHADPRERELISYGNVVAYLRSTTTNVMSSD
jgi:hypothetical protein